VSNVNRHEWGAREPNARYRLNPADVEGVALHWPAMTAKLHTVSDVARALRGWQEFHMDTRGWSDIAYQIAIDQAGNWYQLRGLRNRSGANGDDDVNRRFGAFLLVVAQSEHPTEAMLDTVRHRIVRFRHLFPQAKRIVGHQDVRPEPTDCPGPAIEGLIKRGAFELKEARR
jgi:hypothetical protein